MARCGWSPPPRPFTRGKSGSPVLQDYFLRRGAGDEEVGCSLDEEILMMTDAEKADFAEMQSRLEEQHLSQFYHYHCPRPSEGWVSNDAINVGDRPHRGVRRGSSVDIRVDLGPRAASSARPRISPSRSSSSRRMRGRRRTNSLESYGMPTYHSAQRSRERRVLYENLLEDELTFHPQINRTNVLPRYLDDTARRTKRSDVVDNTAEATSFKPVVNRLPSFSVSDRLSRYLRMPVHKRLGGAASASPRRAEHHHQQQQQQEQQQQQVRQQQQRSAENENRLAQSFLRRLEESNRRREKNLERITAVHERELTLRPVLAPGTRHRRVSSAVAEQIRGRPTTSSAALNVCSEEDETAAEVSQTPEQENYSPQINPRSQAMKRTVDDLRLFEQRRQQRLRQLRVEREAAEREVMSGTPTVSIGSRRLTERVFGADITHDAIQQHLQRHARIRAAALRAEYESRRCEDEAQLTFRPEVHAAPPYVRDIARELVMNKSLAPKASKQRPVFCFS
ncbi:hypothetical protein DQ04_03021000 [Trypanosoma grayi]|uniref:hypothetical protein n=1 Tax=Trypanosoma grayi TaxID=71804 RepID=UPI0004F43018|nr:hypothetical protein DQ04_03021000 [Trypanosoma grayi]KEG11053.1 hypothetical protein DQ04_03021000 [Trypanosoma grayi]